MSLASYKRFCFSHNSSLLVFLIGGQHASHSNLENQVFFIMYLYHLGPCWKREGDSRDASENPCPDISLARTDHMSTPGYKDSEEGLQTLSLSRQLPSRHSRHHERAQVNLGDN